MGKTCEVCGKYRGTHEFEGSNPWCKICGYQWEDKVALNLSQETSKVPLTGIYGKASYPGSGTLSRQQSFENWKPRDAASEFGFNYPSATNSRPPSQPASRPASRYGHRSGSDHSSSKDEKRKGKAVDYSSDRSSRPTHHAEHSSGEAADSTYGSDPEGRRPVIPDHHFTMSIEEAARRQRERDARH